MTLDELNKTAEKSPQDFVDKFKEYSMNFMKQQKEKEAQRKKEIERFKKEQISELKTTEEQLKKQHEKEIKERILGEKETSYYNLLGIKSKIDDKANLKFKIYLSLIAVSIFGVWITLIRLTFIYGWEKIEPWTYFLGLPLTISPYFYFVITKKKLKPTILYKDIKKNIEKIMLATPNTRWFGNRHFPVFPYTQGILNATLRDKYDIKILDADLENLSPQQTKARIKSYHPDVVGISCMSMGYYSNFREVASISKEVCPDSIVVVGGIFPTQLPKALMNDGKVDYSVLGEGEYRFSKLLKCLENGSPIEDIDGLVFRSNSEVKVRGVENYIQNLDEIPFPSYEGIDFDAYANQGIKYNLYLYPRDSPMLLRLPQEVVYLIVFFVVVRQ